ILFYISSYIGLMATPIHLCMAITKDYFNIKMGDFYAILIKQLAILAVTSIIYYILLMNIFN
ncbi:MAG: DUF401 family protein, partial [Atribacterota bacterium]|nr:DUF401 family protein [Atribacterota bacterium]